MKVTSFYYLDYPDFDPKDLTYATTLMYVEIGQDTDSVECFDSTWAFQIYTTRYAADHLINPDVPHIGSAIMIVPTLESEWMEQFLNEHIEEIQKYGERH